MSTISVNKCVTIRCWYALQTTNCMVILTNYWLSAYHWSMFWGRVAKPLIMSNSTLEYPNKLYQSVFRNCGSFKSSGWWWRGRRIVTRNPVLRRLSFEKPLKMCFGFQDRCQLHGFGSRSSLCNGCFLNHSLFQLSVVFTDINCVACGTTQYQQHNQSRPVLHTAQILHSCYQPVTTQ